MALPVWRGDFLFPCFMIRGITVQHGITISTTQIAMPLQLAKSPCVWWYIHINPPCFHLFDDQIPHVSPLLEPPTQARLPSARDSWSPIPCLWHGTLHWNDGPSVEARWIRPLGDGDWWIDRVHWVWEVWVWIMKVRIDCIASMVWPIETKWTHSVWMITNVTWKIPWSNDVTSPSKWPVVTSRITPDPTGFRTTSAVGSCSGESHSWPSN